MSRGDVKEKRDKLQELVGKDPDIKVDTFTNWGKNIKQENMLVCKPKSLEEIQAVVKGCRQLGIRVRATGSTHSWSSVFNDEGQLMLYTKDIKRHDGPQIELKQDPDDANIKHVAVMTGVVTGEFLDFQVKYGVCLPCNVILQDVTLGGVVSAGCHGTGIDCKSVSDYVVAMRIVDSDGVLRTYSIKEDGMDMMLAIQANMGFFGIIYDITFKMDNMIFVQYDNDFVSAEKVFYDKDYIKNLLKDNWAVEVLYFPFNGMSSGEVAEAVFDQDVDWGEWDPKQDEVWIRRVNKLTEVGELKPEKAYKMEAFKAWVEHTLGSAVDDLITSNPALIPSFLKTQVRFIKNTYDGKSVHEPLPNAIHFREYIEKMPVYNAEWAISHDEECNNFHKASHFVIDRLKVLATQGQFPVSLGLEFRLMQHSDVYMAPALAGNPKLGGSGQTLYIEILSMIETKGWYEFVNETGQVWMKLPGARPHWCKDWEMVDGIDANVKKLYKDQFAKFITQLNKSGADPDGIFLNNKFESLMFPKGHKGWRELQKKCNKEENVNENEPKKKSSTCVLL